MDSSGTPEESKHCQCFLLLQDHAPWYHSHTLSPLPPLVLQWAAKCFVQSSACRGITVTVMMLISHTAQGLQGQVLDHSISLWGRKARRVCSLKDWTAVAFHNPLSLLIRFVIFMPSLVFCRRYEVILCYSVPALLPTHSISPACIQQSSGTAGPMVLLQQSIPGTSPRPTVSSAAPSP